MISPPRTVAASLRDRPALVGSIGIAVVTSILAIVTVVARSDVDVASAAFYGVGPVLFTSVGVVILAHHPGHAIGRIALAIGLVLSFSATLVFAVALVDPPGSVTRVLPGIAGVLLEAGIVAAFGLPALAMLLGGALLIVRFPDGRIESRTGRVSQALVGVAVGAASIGSLREPILQNLGYTRTIEMLLDAAEVVAFVGLIGAYLLALLDIGVRYRHALGLRRMQMRWVVAAVTIELVLTILAATLSEAIPSLWTLWIASSILPIVAVAIGITRYHLYDIDRIISQTLTYVVLTVVLFVAFAVVNLLLQQLISPLTDGNAIATAISTLVVAALFNPARIRIQEAVDRRFHRARYDAERTVAAFSERLRDEVDLETLAGELEATVGRAVRPSTSTIWLSDRGGR